MDQKQAKIAKRERSLILGDCLVTVGGLIEFEANGSARIMKVFGSVRFEL